MNYLPVKIIEQNLSEIILFAFEYISSIIENHQSGRSYKIYPDNLEFKGGRIFPDPAKVIRNDNIDDDIIAFGNCLVYLLTGNALSFADLLDPCSIKLEENIPVRLKKLVSRTIQRRITPQEIQKSLKKIKEDMTIPESSVHFRLNKNRDHVYEISLNTPLKLKPIWNFSTHGKIKSSPIIYRDILYCASSDKTLYMLDKNTGEKHADIKLISSIESTPAIYGKYLYIGDDDGNFYHIDILSAGIVSVKNLDNGLIRSSPLITEENVFIGTYNGNLYCLSKDFSAIKYKIKNKGWIHSSCAYLHEHKAVISIWDKGRVGIYSEETGSRLWETDLEDTIRATPVVCNNRIFIAGFAGYLYIFDSSNFELCRKIDIKGKVFSSPVVKDGKIIVCTMQNEIICINMNKGDEDNIIWKFNTEGPVISSPFIADKFVFVADEGGNMYIIDHNTGKGVYECRFENFCRATPFLDDGMLFAASSNQILAYSFDGGV